MGTFQTHYSSVMLLILRKKDWTVGGGYGRKSCEYVCRCFCVPSGDLLWADFERLETFSDEVMFLAGFQLL
jgi:hypothetical protein